MSCELNFNFLEVCKWTRRDTLETVTSLPSSFVTNESTEWRIQAIYVKLHELFEVNEEFQVSINDDPEILQEKLNKLSIFNPNLRHIKKIIKAENKDHEILKYIGVLQHCIDLNAKFVITTQIQHLDFSSNNLSDYFNLLEEIDFQKPNSNFTNVNDFCEKFMEAQESNLEVLHKIFESYKRSLAHATQHDISLDALEKKFKQEFFYIHLKERSAINEKMKNIINRQILLNSQVAETLKNVEECLSNHKELYLVMNCEKLSKQSINLFNEITNDNLSETPATIPNLLDPHLKKTFQVTNVDDLCKIADTYFDYRTKLQELKQFLSI